MVDGQFRTVPLFVEDGHSWAKTQFCQVDLSSCDRLAESSLVLLEIITRLNRYSIPIQFY